jgi:hypothetical protein
MANLENWSWLLCSAARVPRRAEHYFKTRRITERTSGVLREEFRCSAAFGAALSRSGKVDQNLPGSGFSNGDDTVASPPLALATSRKQMVEAPRSPLQERATRTTQEPRGVPAVGRPGLIRSLP